jgi:hypothetical protein
VCIGSELVENGTKMKRCSISENAKEEEKENNAI